MNPYSLIPFSSFLFNTVLAATVFGLNPLSKSNRAFSLFASFFALWAFCNFIEWNLDSQYYISLLQRIEPIIWLPIPVLVMHFVCVLLNRQHGAMFWIFTSLAIGWSIFSLVTGQLIIATKATYWGTIGIVSGWYYIALLTANVIPAIYTFMVMASSLKTVRDSQLRAQIKYLTIGTIIMYTLVILESVVKNAIFKIEAIPFLGSFLLMVQSGFVFLAIVRHRFLQVGIREAANTIFAQIQECVIILDNALVISDMNQAAAEFFGRSAPFFGIPASELPGIGSLSGEKGKNREITPVVNGRSRVGLFSQWPLFEGNRVMGSLIIIRDLTMVRHEEQKRQILEKEIEQSHESRLEALGELAGGIAHDFKNMLMVTHASAEMLLKMVPAHETRQVTYAQHILDASMKGSDLVGRLLTFSRREPVKKVELDVHREIETVVGMLRPTLQGKIAIETLLAAEHTRILADRAQFHSMLVNIAINARDAMPGGGTLRFLTRTVEADPGVTRVNSGLFVVTDIEDTGSGIPESVRSKIFEPYFTTKEAGKGTGLGLSSVYGAVKSHGGFVTFDSSEGNGTTFHLHFPAFFN